MLHFTWLVVKFQLPSPDSFTPWIFGTRSHTSYSLSLTHTHSTHLSLAFSLSLHLSLPLSDLLVSTLKKEIWIFVYVDIFYIFPCFLPVLAIDLSPIIAAASKPMYHPTEVYCFLFWFQLRLSNHRFNDVPSEVGHRFCLLPILLHYSWKENPENACQRVFLYQ